MIEWDSLDIIYEEPFVERLYRDFDFYGEKFRVCLHVIHRCEGNPLMHHHPWPSAMRIIEGSYIQTRGVVFENSPLPAITGTEILHSGTEYTMLDPREVHSIAPITPEVLTLMITGQAWTAPHQRKIAMTGPLAEAAKPTRELEPIYDFRKGAILQKFLDAIS